MPLTQDGPPLGKTPRRLSQQLALPMVVLGALIVGAIGLDRSPITAMDEVFYVEPARMLATRGQLIAPIFAGLRGLSDHYFLHPPGLFVAQAVSFLLFGFGKWQARLPGLFEYGASIALVGLIVARAVPARPWRDWLAAGTALMFACDAGVIQSYRIARPDILATTLMLLSLWALVRTAGDGSEGSPGVLLMAGLLASASAMTYFAMIEILPGALVGALLGARSRREAVRRALFWGAGCALPMAGWGLYILRAPHAFVDQFVTHLHDISKLGGAEPNLFGVIPLHTGPTKPGLADSLLRIVLHWLYFQFMPLGFLALVTLLASGARHVKGGGRVVLAYMTSSFLLLLNGRALLANVVALLYLGTAVSLAAGWDAGVRWIHSRWARVLFIATPLSYLPIPVARLITTLVQWQARSAKPLQELVRKYVPPGVPVAGVPEAYFAAVENGDDYYYSTPLTGLLVFPKPDDQPQFEAAMANIRPRYLLVNSAFDPTTAPGMPRSATYEQVASYVAPSLHIGWLQHGGYDVVLWKVGYR